MPLKFTDDKEKLQRVIDYLSSQKPYPPHNYPRIYTKADDTVLQRQGIIDMPL
jgi:hypothetical protein